MLSRTGLLQLGIIVALAAIIVLPILLLRGETKRADAAENEVRVQIQNTQTATAGARQAESQVEIIDDLNAGRAETLAIVNAGVAELEAMADAEIPTGDRADDLVRELRARAASDHARALARYRERNPDHADNAPGSAGV